MANLTKKQKTELIPAAIVAYLNETGTSQPALADLAGINKAYVNQIILKKEFIGKTEIKDKYYEAIAKAIGFKLNKSYWKHFNTYNFKEAILTFDKARKQKSRKGLDGDTGLGKSYAAEMYKMRYPNSTFLVKCSGIENTKEFAMNLAQEVGVSTIGTKATIVKEACRRLKSLGNDPILIIDEFENSKTSNIPTVKAIADELEGFAAVVVIGIDVQKMLEKGAERRKNGFVQTNRRWSFAWSKFDNDITDDVEYICNELGIKNRAAINWLKNRVKDFDSLKNICVSALEESEKSELEVTQYLLNELYPL